MASMTIDHTGYDPIDGVEGSPCEAEDCMNMFDDWDSRVDLYLCYQHIDEVTDALLDRPHWDEGYDGGGYYHA